MVFMIVGVMFTYAQACNTGLQPSPLPVPTTTITPDSAASTASAGTSAVISGTPASTLTPATTSTPVSSTFTTTPVASTTPAPVTTPTPTPSTTPATSTAPNTGAPAPVTNQAAANAASIGTLSVPNGASTQVTGETQLSTAELGETIVVGTLTYVRTNVNVPVSALNPHGVATVWQQQNDPSIQLSSPALFALAKKSSAQPILLSTDDYASLAPDLQGSLTSSGTGPTTTYYYQGQQVQGLLTDNADNVEGFYTATTSVQKISDGLYVVTTGSGTSETAFLSTDMKTPVPGTSIKTAEEGSTPGSDEYGDANGGIVEEGCFNNAKGCYQTLPNAQGTYAQIIPDGKAGVTTIQYSAEDNPTSITEKYTNGDVGQESYDANGNPGDYKISDAEGNVLFIADDYAASTVAGGSKIYYINSQGQLNAVTLDANGNPISPTSNPHAPPPAVVSDSVLSQQAQDDLHNTELWSGRSPLAVTLAQFDTANRNFGWLTNLIGVGAWSNAWSSLFDKTFATTIEWGTVKGASENICQAYSDRTSAPENIYIGDSGDGAADVAGKRSDMYDENRTHFYIYEIIYDVQNAILIDTSKTLTVNTYIVRGGTKYPLDLQDGVSGTNSFPIGGSVTEASALGNSMIIRLSDETVPYDEVCLDFHDSSLLVGTFRAYLKNGELCDDFFSTSAPMPSSPINVQAFYNSLYGIGGSSGSSNTNVGSSSSASSPAPGTVTNSGGIHSEGLG